MSTLSHHAQPVVRSRMALVILATVTALVIAVVLIATHGTSSDSFSASSTQTPQEQLQSVAGARYGLDQGIVRTEAPQQQLQAVAGARYHVNAKAFAH